MAPKSMYEEVSRNRVITIVQVAIAVELSPGWVESNYL